MKISIDRLLDTATVDEYIKIESESVGITWLRDFWARFLVDDKGAAIEIEAAKKMLGRLTLVQFRTLRREGELRDTAVPLESDSS